VVGLIGHYKTALTLEVDGPLSPLWQQGLGAGIDAQPCIHAKNQNPGPRTGFGEEVVNRGAAKELRTHSATLTPTIDKCLDWEEPATEGAYLVACYQPALDAFIARGLEGRHGGSLSIDVPLQDKPTFTSIPAVHRDFQVHNIAQWTIEAAKPAKHVEIYASLADPGHQPRNAVFDVDVRAGEQFFVDNHAPFHWRLRNQDGVVLCTIVPNRQTGTRVARTRCERPAGIPALPAG
jgi:hypothetical protein